MASSALRAAQIMRTLPLRGTWKQTSRMISCGIRTPSNSIINTISIVQRLNQMPSHKYVAPMMSFQLPRFNTTVAAQPDEEQPSQSERTYDPMLFDRTIAGFEDRCHRSEGVSEKEFVRTFSYYTKTFDGLKKGQKENVMGNFIEYSSFLLRCCGSIMFDTPPKGRELLAGNLWTYIKERKIPLNISHYNNLIRVMNENETVYDPQMILDEIKQNSLQPDRVTYQRLIRQYCLRGDIPNALKLLETMKDEDIELNETIFASLIIGYCKQEKPPTATEMFDLMRQNKIEPGTESYVTALCAQAGRLASEPEAAKEELAKIIELIDKDDVQFSQKELLYIIEHLGPHKASQALIEDFFARYINTLNGTITFRYRMIAGLFRVDQKEYASHLFWSHRVTERGLQAGRLGIYYTRALAKHFNLPVDFAISECSQLVEKRYNPKAFEMLYRFAAENGNVKLARAAMKEMFKDAPIKVVYTWPLIAQAQNQDEIIDVLRVDLNTRANTNDLLDTFALWVWPKFAEEPLKLLRLSKELNLDTNILIASFLIYAVEQNKVGDAIKFIEEVLPGLLDESSKTSEADEAEDNDIEPSTALRMQTDRGSLVSRLLNQIIERTKDPQLVIKAFEMCKLQDQKPSLQSLAALVRAHLVVNDFNGALDQFLKICKEYRVSPRRTELMKHCLINKDPESLQKIMNASSAIHGENNALFDLAVCCLLTDKLKQAQKIFASPGFRVRPNRVYKVCQSFSSQDNVTALENFVNLVRDMYDINQEYLYQSLIETYDRTNNVKRVLNLWNNMQEEEFQPSRKSLTMIAELLEKHNIQVPFQKPMSHENQHSSQAQRDAGP